MATKMLSSWQRGLLAAALVLVGGCVSVPEVEPPDPSADDTSGQVRLFEGVTPDQLLQAAELVLREHLPKGKVDREGSSLVVKYSSWGYYVLVAGDSVEKWKVATRQTGDSTIASVAARGSGWGFFLGLSGGSEWPIEPGFLRVELRVDYRMFWRRVESILSLEPWPECEKRKKPANRQRKKVLYQTFDPLCIQLDLVYEEE